MIEIAFGADWATDLGTGLANNAEIPCLGITGIIPEDGYKIKCILKAGSGPTVQVKNFKLIANGAICNIHIPKI